MIQLYNFTRPNICFLFASGSLSDPNIVILHEDCEGVVWGELPPDSVNLADLISFIAYRFFLIQESIKLNCNQIWAKRQQAVLHSNMTHEWGVKSPIYHLALRKTWQCSITSSIPTLTIKFFTGVFKYVDKASI